MAATVLVTSCPIIVVFFFAQKAFVQGVTLTGVKGVKIAVVGGGSTYTPELVDGFARLARELAIDELALVDPAADRLGMVGPLAERIFARHGHPVKISWTADLDDGRLATPTSW